MTRAVDLTAPRTGGDAPPPVAYHQGVVVAYNPDTGANTIQVAGSTHTDLPVLGVTDSLGLLPGNTVSVLYWQSQFWLIGRVARPGSGDFGQLIVRNSNGDYVQLRDGGVVFFEGSVAAQSPGVMIPFSPGSGELGLQITPPFTTGSVGDNRIMLGGATAGSLGGMELITQGHAYLWSMQDILWLIGADSAVIEANGAPGDMFVDATGSTVIGADTNNVFIDHNTTASAANCRIESTGQILRSTSSARYKQDINDLDLDPAVVLRLRPRTWTERAAPPGRARPQRPPRATPSGQRTPTTKATTKAATAPRRGVGFVAEELADLGLSQFVELDELGRPDAIAYDRLTAALLVVAKAQQEQIDALSARVAALEGRP